MTTSAGSMRIGSMWNSSMRLRSTSTTASRLLRHLAADAAVLPALVEADAAEPEGLQQRAQALDELQPGQAREEGQARGEQRQ